MIVRAFTTLTWATLATAVASAVLLANIDAPLARLFGTPARPGAAAAVRPAADAARARHRDDAPRAASSGRTAPR